MTTLDSSQWMYSSASGFYPHNIDQSLRFNSADTAYLTKTFPSSAGNQKTFTFSCWIKPCAFGSIQQPIFSAYASTVSYWILGFDLTGFISSGDSLKLWGAYNNSVTVRLTTNAVFRDSSAWYNIVLAEDTTQSTASNRVKLYVNGEQITSFATETYPSQNATELVNDASTLHQIGGLASGTYGEIDAYMADVNFIDGQALAPTSFGETKAGIWVPKDTSSLTFGTNGFRLKFQDNSSTSTLGDDTSGNGNDYSSSGLATTDVVLDSPTNNWATLNPLAANQSATLSEGNLKLVTTNSGYAMRLSTIQMPTSGKWYWEGLLVANSSGAKAILGVSSYDSAATQFFVDGSVVSLGYYQETGYLYGNQDTSGSSYGATYAAGDIIGVAVNLDDDEVTFYKNNSSQGADSFDAAGLFAIFGDYSNSVGCTWAVNFGQDSSFAGNKTSGSAGASDANGKGDFYYSPPSGFLALCTANLPNPGIDPAEDEEPTDYFNTVLWQGNDVDDRAISGVGFQPNWVWIKNRDVAEAHNLYDVIRGAEQQLYSNSGDVEFDRGVYGLKSFTSDGFTLGTGGEVNDSSEKYVAWNWLAGGSASSNSNGSITSSVSANTKAGFSIVSYTGNGTAGATVGHGLSSTPEVYIVKSRSLGTSWVTYHKDASSTPEDGYLVLNGTDAFFDTVVWNDTAPTSSVFSLGGTGYSSNNSGATYIAYCFHSVEGYSKFGSYTGNGSTDGPFVYTGFRPALVIVKNITGSESWGIGDSVRDPSNVLLNRLYPNLSNAEYSTGDWLDLVSNGFKSRGSAFNTSSATYIYLAFAEQPFKYSNAR